MKEKTVYVMSAWTKYANTQESDRVYRVVCVVKVSDGREMDVVATDPLDAIQQVEMQLQKGQ
jgi:hypothetical protein